MDAFRDALGPDVDDLVDEAIETGDIDDPGEPARGGAMYLLLIRRPGSELAQVGINRRAAAG